MGIRWRGHDLSFTQPELEGQVVDVAAVEDLSAKKREMGFPLWGGDKTWLAPQTRWTEGAPFLDLNSGAYELAIEQAGPDLARARMTSRVCRETGVQITRTVTMKAGETAWTVDHCLTNGSVGGGGRMGPLGCEHGVKDRQSLFAAISEVGVSRGSEDRSAGRSISAAA